MENEKKSLMRALFKAEYNQKKFSGFNPPPAIAAMLVKRAKSKRARMAELGIPESDYRKFVESYWLIHESEEIGGEYYLSCLTVMRQIQAYQKEHGGSLPNFLSNSECVHKRGTTCSPMCPKFEKASPEQDTNFINFRDINTGEPYEVRELTDEELGQDE